MKPKTQRNCNLFHPEIDRIWGPALGYTAEPNQTGPRGVLLRRSPSSNRGAPDRRVRKDRRRNDRGGRRNSDSSRLRKALAAATVTSRATKPLVLVVDDFADGREMLAEYLRFRGFAVEEAGTGVEALAICCRGAADVLVLDLALPDLDGLEVVARLRRSAMKMPKVVVWTARVMEDVRHQVAAAGVEMFIPKPCDIQLVALQVTQLAQSVVTLTT